MQIEAKSTDDVMKCRITVQQQQFIVDKRRVELGVKAQGSQFNRSQE